MTATLTPVSNTDPSAGRIDARLSHTPTEGYAIELPSGLVIILHDNPAASFVGIDIERPDGSTVDSLHFGRPRKEA